MFFRTDVDDEALGNLVGDVGLSRATEDSIRKKTPYQSVRRESNGTSRQTVRERSTNERNAQR